MQPGVANAEPYPTRLVTLVVPQAAGGINDIVGRLVGQKLGEVPRPPTPDQFAALLQDDLAKWARIVKASGAAVD